MFRHRGQNRTALHNIQLASLLSFVAGVVNVVGFIAVGRLTTSVTGHFVFFSEELVHQEYKYSFIFLLYILSFLLGAFVSNFSIEIFTRLKEKYRNAIPISIEIIILIFVALANDSYLADNKDFLACILLFAM